MTEHDDKQKVDAKEKSVAAPKKLSLKKTSVTPTEEKEESVKPTTKIALKKMWPVNLQSLKRKGAVRFVMWM